MPSFCRAPFMPRFVAAAVALALVSLAVSNADAVTIDWVAVGDPGNSNNTTGFGAVNYEYQMGKYEVTIQQYADFLNAVAASDPYSLYNTNMDSDLNIAGISRAGASGSYTYSVTNNGGYSGNRPITYVSWFDAARFANWMQNGQGLGSTETGAYTLNGQTTGTAPEKNDEAQFYIPTENEWYKAAYYSQLLNSGSGGYYRYATQSDTSPGNTIGNGNNQANWYKDVYAVTQADGYDANQNYLTDVGAFTNSMSYYGTFDQSGNVFEWTANGLGGLRGTRGGDWFISDDGSGQPFYISSGYSPLVATDNWAPSIGFRLASPVAVPELTLSPFLDPSGMSGFVTLASPERVGFLGGKEALFGGADCVRAAAG